MPNERSTYLDGPEGGMLTRSRRHTAPVPILPVSHPMSPGGTFDTTFSYGAGPSSSGSSLAISTVSPSNYAGPSTQLASPTEDGGGDADSGGASRPTGKRKRSRVTPAQLTHLERAFAKDRSPTAAKRKELSELLGMNERQTQVWFQNRRAKAKLLEQRARSNRLAAGHLRGDLPGDSGMGSDSVPDRDLQALLHEDEPITPFPCSDLSIGSFRRISAGLHDLVGYTCEGRRCLTWYIYSAGSGFKMEIPYENISSAEQFNDAPPNQLHVALNLTRPPQFFRETPSLSPSATATAKIWQPCDDWTEGRQASTALRHIVYGSATELEQAVAPFIVDLLSNIPSSYAGSSNHSSSDASPSSIHPPALLSIGLAGTASLTPPSSFMDPFAPRGSHLGHARKRSRSYTIPYDNNRQSYGIRTPVSAPMTELSSSSSVPSGGSAFARMQDDHSSTDYSSTFSDFDYLSFQPSGSPVDASLIEAHSVPISRSYSTSIATSSSGMYPTSSVSRPSSSSSAFAGVVGGERGTGPTVAQLSDFSSLHPGAASHSQVSQHHHVHSVYGGSLESSSRTTSSPSLFHPNSGYVTAGVDGATSHTQFNADSSILHNMPTEFDLMPTTFASQSHLHSSSGNEIHSIRGDGTQLETASRGGGESQVTSMPGNDHLNGAFTGMFESSAS